MFERVTVQYGSWTVSQKYGYPGGPYYFIQKDNMRIILSSIFSKSLSTALELADLYDRIEKAVETKPEQKEEKVTT